MRRLTEEAVLAGAFGFTTSRTNAHKTTQGARYVIRQETFAGTHGNGRDAPIPAVRGVASNRPGST